MNQVCLIGRLARDPELRHTAGGTAVAKLSVAVDGAGPRDESEGKNGPGFFEVTVWDTQAENCAQYLIKGQQVGITGSLYFNQWHDKESGKNRNKVEVKAFRVDFLAKPRGSEEDDDGQTRFEPAGMPPGASSSPASHADDDIPFSPTSMDSWL